MIKIKKEVVDFVAEAARNLHPKEFSALLKIDNNTVNEVIVVPMTNFGNGFTIMEFMHLPITVKYQGSVHSHPSYSNQPSITDISFFSKTGKYHLIISFPYLPENIAAYNNKGERIDFEII